MRVAAIQAPHLSGGPPESHQPPVGERPRHMDLQGHQLGLESLQPKLHSGWSTLTVRQPWDDGPPLQSRATDGRVSRRMKAVDRWMDPMVLYPARLHQGKQFFLIVQEPRAYIWIKAPFGIFIHP